ncbi:Putative aminopeptidase YsdC [Sedimentisphaera cyanobacteriorum]|uniref:Aminopeptidase YsdC n=1 Tax=Sedimentisphaera cyanobacteriorum TaxID=1940790 RepID=A0A1Q2HRZ5_9BACT|nr:M42 family metallopeptidase [Sedimentisphaera cyanobacteriorum]AQQ10238.1 Putative aminopeptidase YsdC [Sedimentisphaera cyanobacteriorum]
MDKQRLDFFKELLNTPSPSGSELPAAKVWRSRVGEKVENISSDSHGNSIAVLNPEADFKFMLAGHIDEIGLMITYIDDDGFLYTGQVGGMDPALLVGQRVRILTDSGEVPGVIGRKAIHQMKPDERKKNVEMENIWVDIGASGKEEAKKLVSVGDPMVVDVNCRELTEDRITSRGTDDKAGAFTVAEIMRELADRDLNICVAGVATVQEELGIRGARTSAFSVNPDAGIAFDVNFSSDHPETDKKKLGELKLGEGPNIQRGPNMNPILNKCLFETAKKHDIKYQVTSAPRATGTDANAIQVNRGSVATGLIGIPNRYMHTPVEIVSLSDIENVIKLVTEFLAEHPAQRDYRL